MLQMYHLLQHLKANKAITGVQRSGCMSEYFPTYLKTSSPFCVSPHGWCRFSIEVRLFSPPRGMASKLKQPAPRSPSGRETAWEAGEDVWAAGEDVWTAGEGVFPREAAAGNCCRAYWSPPFCLHPERGGIRRCWAPFKPHSEHEIPPPSSALYVHGCPVRVRAGACS